jgi:uncharacterized membrane protein
MEHEADLSRFFPLERTIAFSDGVFAVVITILVLGIDAPPEGALAATDLGSLLDKLGHQLLIYIVSFWVIAMYWSAHSILFGALSRMDRGLLVLNLLFLLPVTLLPLVTQLMGANRTDWRLVLVYGATNLCLVYVLRRSWKHVAARPETHTNAGTAMLAERIVRGSRLFAAIALGGVLVSMLDVKTGIGLFLLMPVFYFSNHARHLLGPRSRSGDGDRGRA